MKKIPREITPAVEQLINETLAMETDSAQNAGAMGFLARAMVQATLPHKKVEGNEFERTNGAFTLSLLAPAKIGLPYGTVPRLLLAWVATEAVRTQSRELSLGSSMNMFMAQLDMGRTGGERGDITRLKEQTRRLFSATVSASYNDKKKSADIGFRLADEVILWWDAKDPGQAPLWGSTVTLSERFYREITAHPIPVDMRAMHSLKRSPLALDIYGWLTYRSSYAKKATVIPWEALAMQFGSDYGRLRAFKAAFLAELRKVAAVYTGAQFDVAEGGLIVKPGRPHVAKQCPR